MELGGAPGNRQPQSGAFCLSTIFRNDLAERCQRLRDIGRGDTDSGIADAEDYLRPFRLDE